jgi:hypothetical protein
VLFAAGVEHFEENLHDSQHAYCLRRHHRCGVLSPDVRFVARAANRYGGNGGAGV